MDSEQISQKFRENLEAPNTSPAHASIRTLTQVIEASTEQTVQGLSKELERAASILYNEAESRSKILGRTPLSVIAGCDMFRHHTSKTLAALDYDDFPKLKAKLVERGYYLSETRPAFLQKIADMAICCFKDNQSVLVHGYSNVVNRILVKAAEQFHITVIVTECRPFCEGYIMCEELKKHNIQFTLIMDNAVASVMDGIDMVMVGAEAVVESGGVINRIGTYGIGLIAKFFKKPLYVCTESLKFVRMFPLSQRDLPECTKSTCPPIQECKAVDSISMTVCDLTPPELISLMFTDLGILTPSAISDELIMLYNQ
ncbi:unnamed protein product [Blepharisma stoltei]|uniref:Translation initiation factor eIF2B subunit alpha n=1 Tax=Blepharisma stoltei TaxID=1481888 RepID=A0AAU9JK15_9CILI|nr:unnamed protein product [Blepharisma stoltei]